MNKIRVISGRSSWKIVNASMASLAELELGLIDRNEVPSFMTMTIKGWIEAEETAIAAKDSTIRPRDLWEEPDSTTMLPAEVTGQGITQ